MAKIASGSIDLKSLKVAGAGASKYITDITNNGIKVASATAKDLNYVTIDATGMNIYKSDGASTPSPVSVASFGEIVRIGKSDGPNITIDNTSMVGQSEVQYFSIDATGSREDTWVSMGKSYSSVRNSKVILDLSQPHDADTYTSAWDCSSVWNSLSNGTSFQVKYIERSRNDGTVKTYTETFTFVKGTAKNWDLYNTNEFDEVIYNGADYLALGRVPVSIHSKTVNPMYLKTVYTPVYKFGKNIQSSTGANSFILGTGNVSNYANQLVLGNYNIDCDAALVIGSGISDTKRNNCFYVKNDGTVFANGTMHCNGDLSTYGNLTMLGHSSPIGSIVVKNGGEDYTTNLSSETDTWKAIGHINLNEGRWIVVGRARFDPSSSGAHYSSVNIGTSSAMEASRDKRYGAGTAANQHTVVAIITISTDETPVYLNGSSTAAGSWVRTNASAFYLGAIRIR